MNTANEIKASAIIDLKHRFRVMRETKRKVAQVKYNQCRGDVLNWGILNLNEVDAIEYEVTKQLKKKEKGEFTEKALKDGKDFAFDNLAWCEENESDDIVGGYIYFNDRHCRFFIMFNGKCIYSSKGFLPAKNRLLSLMVKWHCLFIKATD